MTLPALFDHRTRLIRSALPRCQGEAFLAVHCLNEVAGRFEMLGGTSQHKGVIGADSHETLALARNRLDPMSSVPISYTEPSSELLMAQPGSFPALGVIMTLHWINDLPGLLVQFKNSLSADGLFAAAFPGGRTLFELRHVLTVAETAILGGASPRVSPFLDIRDAGALLARSGLTEPVVDISTLTCTYPGPIELMHDLRAMNQSNALMGASERPLRKDVLAEACRLYRELYPASNDRIQATFEIICMTAWAASA